MYKQMNKCYLYNMLNDGNSLVKDADKLIKNGKTLTEKMISDHINTINNNYRFILKSKVIEYVHSGKIVLKYLAESKLPSFMPFFLSNTDDGVKAFINVKAHGGVLASSDRIEGDYLKLDTKILYTMLEGAYFALEIFNNSRGLNHANSTIKKGSAVYANMFAKVLDKKYSLSIMNMHSTNKLDIVIFLASKFYLVNMLGMTNNDLTTKYAMNNCKSSNEIILSNINNLVKAESYTDIKSFIETLTNPDLNLKLNKLTVRNYIEEFIKMYYSPALLGLENFTYFFYNVCAVINGAHINNSNVLDNVVGNDGAAIYSELSNILR